MEKIIQYDRIEMDEIVEEDDGYLPEGVITLSVHPTVVVSKHTALGQLPLDAGTNEKRINKRRRRRRRTRQAKYVWMWNVILYCR